MYLFFPGIELQNITLNISQLNMLICIYEHDKSQWYTTNTLLLLLVEQGVIYSIVCGILYRLCDDDDDDYDATHHHHQTPGGDGDVKGQGIIISSSIVTPLWTYIKMECN